MQVTQTKQHCLSTICLLWTIVDAAVLFVLVLKFQNLLVATASPLTPSKHLARTAWIQQFLMLPPSSRVRRYGWRGVAETEYWSACADCSEEELWLEIGARGEVGSVRIEQAPAGTAPWRKNFGARRVFWLSRVC